MSAVRAREGLDPREGTSPGRRNVLRAAGVMLLVIMPQFPERMVAIFAPELAGHFALSKAELGLLFSCCAWGSLLGALAAGVLGGKLSGLRVFRIGMFTAGMGFSLCGLVSTHTLISLLLLASFLGASLGWVASFGLLAALAPNAPRRTYSLQFVVYAAAAMVMPLFCGALLKWAVLAPGITPVGVFQSSLTMVGIAMCLGTVLLPGGAASESALRSDAGNKGLGWTVALLPILLGAIHVGTDSALYVWAPTFFEESFGEVLFPPAWILSAYAFSYFIGRGLLILWPEGRHERLLLVGPGLVGGMLLFLGLLVPVYWASALLYVSASFFYGMEYPVLLGVLARRLPSRLNGIIGVSAACGYGLYGIFCLTVGCLAESTGECRTAMLLFPAGFISFGVLAWVWTVRWQTPASLEPVHVG